MPRGYRSYRGRRTRRGKIPIVFAALFLLIALGLLYLSLSDSLVFSSEGILFKNPFANKEKDEPTPSPLPSQLPGLIIESPSPSKTPEPSPTPTPKHETVINAAYLPSLSDPVAIAGIIQLSENGTINAVVIDMKHDDGTLSYSSANQYAEQAGANPSEDYSVTALKELRDSGLYLIARVSAFKDNLVPRKIQSLSVKVQSGVIWLDRDYHGWMNPYLQEAQDYVTDISLELADLGFDEVLLENFCYPTIGRPQLIAYGEHDSVPKTDTISSFTEHLSALLREKNALLSISLSSDTVIEGADTALGHDVASLYEVSDRIYVNIGTDADTSSAIYAKVQEIAQDYDTQDVSVKLVPVIVSLRSYDDPSASENIQVAIGTYVPRGYGWVIYDDSGLYPSVGW
jgi:hypothetical protein